VALGILAVITAGRPVLALAGTMPGHDAGTLPALAPAASWQLMASGTMARLWGVWGSSRQDVFAVGSSGVILHYDGASWHSMDSWTAGDLHAVWGSSSSDVFAVGADHGTYPPTGIILHYDGVSWRRMDSGTAGGLAGVWGSSSSDVFAVGGGGAILHYDGATWDSMDSGTVLDLKGLWGSGSSDVFAVGDDETILHYTGATWQPMATPRDWCGQGSPAGSSFFLYGVWGSNGDDVFAAGGCSAPSAATYSAILHHDGAAWSAASVNGPHASDTYFMSVWGHNDQDVFAVDNTGAIVRYDGAGWQPMASGTDRDLRGVWGNGGETFAVGGYGVILHYVEAQPPTGCDTVPMPTPPYTNTMPISGTVALQVNRSLDDAYVTLGSTTDLYTDTRSIRMGGRPGVAVPYVEYVTGLLFRDLPVPRCAQITSAKLRMNTWYQSGVPVEVEVAGQLSPQADTFSVENPWPHQRPKTAQRTPWTLTKPVSGTVESPDLATVVQEIVWQDGWQEGNNLALVISPVLTGKQTMDWQAYDFKPEGAAQLLIHYQAVVTRPRLYLPLVSH